MANIKVSELNTATSFNDEDYTMIVQNGENKKITKENMNKSICGEYLTATMTNDYSFQQPNNAEILPLNIKDTNTNKLTLTNNKIIIGAGVHTILVSAQLYFYTGIASTEGIGYIFINNNNAIVHNQRFANDEYEHMTMPTRVFSVNENDEISLGALIYDITNNPIIKNYNNGTFLNVVILN